jgi:predicted PurR-regulated permease PerM
MITFVIPPIVQQTAKFIETIPSMVDSASTQWGAVNHWIDEYNLREQVDTAMQSIRDNASQWAANVGQGVVASVGSIFSFLAASFLVFVLTFLMLVEGPTWLRRWYSVYQDHDKMVRHEKIAHRMYNVVTGYVTGQLTVSAIGAASAALAVFVISFVFPEVPANLSLPTAAIAFLFSLIPMFGSTIGGILVSLLIAFNSFPAAIVFAVFFVIYQQIENNFIAPHIQARKIDLSALVVLVAITVGIYMFGLVGGIIAIPIAGCIKVLIEEYLAEARVKREQSKKPIAKLVKKLQGEDA